jgi:hypothetical protein
MLRRYFGGIRYNAKIDVLELPGRDAHRIKILGPYFDIYPPD